MTTKQDLRDTRDHLLANKNGREEGNDIDSQSAYIAAAIYSVGEAVVTALEEIRDTLASRSLP